MKYFDIRDYGARTGELSTDAIQRAFDAADLSGGTVIIPAGTYISGTVDMHGASLYLEKGAVLKASGSMEDYRANGYAHNEMGQVYSLLYSLGHSDITISGEGTIDLSGHCFVDYEKPIEYKDFYDCRLSQLTEEQLKECCVQFGARPNQPIFFYDCSHVTVRDIKIIDSPCWTITFVSSRDLRVLDVTIDNDLRICNNDGIHFSCCKDMLVRGCNISAGDDCIAFSCITNWQDSCERGIVSDCILRSCSKALSIGYAHSVIRDLTISNCVVYESNRACAFMCSPGTGRIENVVMTNLRLDARAYAGNWWGNGEPICIMSTKHNETHFRDDMPKKRFDVGISNVLISGAVCSGENVIAVVGDEGMVRDVHMNDISFTRRPFKNCSIKGHMVDLAPGYQTAFLPEDEHAWLYLRGLIDCSFTNCHPAAENGVKPDVIMSDCVSTIIN